MLIWFRSLSILFFYLFFKLIGTSTASDCRKGIQSSWVSGTASATVFIGAIAGQLTMGFLGDLIGRNKAMVLTLSLTSFAALCSAVFSLGNPESTYAIIILFRFLLGIGLGGLYPLTATKAAEDAKKNESVHNSNSHDLIEEDNMETKDEVNSLSAAKAFFWQVPGSMMPWVLANILTYCPSISIGIRWRLILGFGSVPALILVFLTMYEIQISPEYLKTRVSLSMKSSVNTNQLICQDKKDMQNDLSDSITYSLLNNNHDDTDNFECRLIGIEQYNQRKEVNIWTIMQQWDYQYKLIGTGGCWFLYDICYYGVNLFGGEILNSISTSEDDDVTSDTNVRLITAKQLLALGTAMPACILTIIVLSHMSTKLVQIIGFIFIAIMFLLLTTLLKTLDNSPNALFVLYCLLVFSLNFGPNVTTFILPSETFPKEIRATCNGISAAMGKLGAVVGAYTFGPLATATSFSFVFACCTIIAFAGSLLSYRFIDKKST